MYSGEPGTRSDWKTLIDVQAELEARGLPIQLLFEGGGASWNDARACSEDRKLRRRIRTGQVSETESFQTAPVQRAFRSNPERSAQGLLWPSKLARVLPTSKPLLWIGPTEGAIACSLSGRPFTAAFEPGASGPIADWIQKLWQQRDLIPAEKPDVLVEKIYRQQGWRASNYSRRGSKRLSVFIIPPIALFYHLVENIVATPSHQLVAANNTQQLARISCAACVAIVWFILCRYLSNEWAINEQYSYGWFVPFFAAYLFWLRWEDRPPRGGGSSKLQAPSSTATFATAIVLLLLLLPVRLFEIGNPDWRPLGWIACGTIVAGLTLLLLCIIGAEAWLKHFAFPICFIFVAVPWVSRN